MTERHKERKRKRGSARDGARERGREGESEIWKGLLLLVTEKSSGLAVRLECGSRDKVGHKRLRLTIFFNFFLAVFLPRVPPTGLPNAGFFRVYAVLQSDLGVVVYPQMLSVALLYVCAVAFGRVSGRSDSGNFLDDKWLTGRWDKFRDVSCILTAPSSQRPHW